MELNNNKSSLRPLQEELEFIASRYWTDAAKQIEVDIEVGDINTLVFSPVTASIWRIAYDDIIEEIEGVEYPYGVFQIEAFSPRFLT